MTNTERGSSTNIDTHLDARGLRCPMPLLRAKQALNKMRAGQTLEVLATDAGSVRDFKSYAELSAHSLIVQKEDNGVYIHIIKKGAE